MPTQTHKSQTFVMAHAGEYICRHENPQMLIDDADT